jgi:hypothetical protein
MCVPVPNHDLGFQNTTSIACTCFEHHNCSPLGCCFPSGLSPRENSTPRIMMFTLSADNNCRPMKNSDVSLGYQFCKNITFILYIIYNERYNNIGYCMNISEYCGTTIYVPFLSGNVSVFAFRNYNLDRKLKTQIWSLWKHKIKTHK